MIPLFIKIKEIFGERLKVGVSGHLPLKSLAIGLIIFLSAFFILSIDLLPNRIDKELGEVSSRDIEAPITFENRYRTEKAQQQAADEAVKEALRQDEIYIISQSTVSQAEQELDSLFKSITDIKMLEEEDMEENMDLDLDEVASNIIERYDLNISHSDIMPLLKLDLEDIQAIEKQSIDVFLSVMQTERISPGNLDEIRQMISGKTGDMDIDSSLEPAVGGIMARHIQPNLEVDEARIEQVRMEAINSVKAEQVLKGELIVRRGDIITEEQIALLKDLGILHDGGDYRALMGLAAFLMGLILIIVIYIYQHDGKMLRDKTIIGLVGLIFILVTAAIKLLSIISHLTGWTWLVYLIPSAFATMLITVLVNSRMGIILAVSLSAIVAIVFPQDVMYFMVALAGGLVGVFSISKISQRFDLIRAGLIVGITNMMTIIALGFLQLIDVREVLLSSGIGFASGIFSSILAIGCLPFFEYLFGITSTVKLLEISNPNHPVLKQLLLAAPGTYHHSIIVGNLAEAASEAIGANPLITRVASHYHDIGKIKRPYFFSENQLTKENPHDKIAPNLSTLIITSHVKDGVEMARYHKLPEIIVDIIKQHHGTTTVSCFYHSALEEEGSIDENDFKYPGPKPQSKEAAMVMLADSVEAAVRSLSNHSSGKIEGIVRKIIKEKLSGGQFDECNITLRDLNKAASAFVSILGGIFHSRVEYPEGFIREVERRKAE